MMRLLMVIGLAAASGALAQEGGRMMVCDFDETEVPWRSKFSAHEVVEATVDGKSTRVLRLPF
ncbi:MAG: hypothetical protein ACP5KN_19940, partial [Armatimonadota bacterium]